MRKVIIETLNENGVTIDQLIKPSQRCQADSIEDYLNDALIMFDDFPDDAKQYIEIALHCHKERRKQFAYTELTK